MIDYIVTAFDELFATIPFAEAMLFMVVVGWCCMAYIAYSNTPKVKRKLHGDWRDYP